MNSVLKKVYDEGVPKFNEKITNGFAVTVVNKAAEYIDRVIRSSMKSATPLLKYHGYRRLTPNEELATITSMSNFKKPYDLAGTDIYLIELLFTYNGEKLKDRYLYLPFVGDGGIMTISGTKYNIAPVLTDTVISPLDTKLFVRLLRDKLTFRSIKRNFLLNNKIFIGDVIYSEELHRIRVNKNELGKVYPPTALYLFSNEGIMNTFKHRCNIVPIITTDINIVQSLKDTHDIYTTTGSKPRSLKNVNYRKHDAHICIKKNNRTSLIKSLISSFLYTLDILPEVCNDMVKIINVNDTTSEVKYWKILLSRIIFKDTYSPDNGYVAITDHYKTLDSYMDPIIKEKLKESGIKVDTFFDLLTMILDKFNEWLAKGKEYTNNIYNRYIDVLYYLLYDLIVGINKSITEITKMSKTKNLLPDKVGSIMNMQLPKRRIFKISKSKEQNIILQLVDTSTDSKYLKITSVMELQERGKGVRRGTNTFPENTRSITGPDLFIGSLLFLPKKVPTPKVRINPFATYDEETKRISPDKETKHILDTLDIMLQGRIEDDNDKLKNSIDDSIEEGLMDD